MLMKRAFLVLLVASIVIGVHMVGFAEPEKPWDDYCTCKETPCPGVEGITPVPYVPCKWFQNPGGVSSCACTKDTGYYVMPEDPATRVCEKNALGKNELKCGSTCDEKTAPTSCKDCFTTCPVPFVRPTSSDCDHIGNFAHCEDPGTVVCAGTKPS